MRKLVLTALLPSFIALAGPANATLFTATFEGHITAGAINQPSFGLAAGANVVGLKYTATYTIDDGLGSAEYDTPTSTEIIGGYQLAPLGNPPTPANGAFQLNGSALAVAGLYLGDIAKTYLPAELFSNYSAAVETLTNIPQGQVDLQLRQSIIVDSAVFSSSDFRDTGTYSAVTLGLDPPVDPTYSDLFVQSYMTADLLTDPYGNPVDGNPNLFFLNLQPDSLTIALVSSVPETSTRAMLIIGLGAIGAAIRRRGFARHRGVAAV